MLTLLLKKEFFHLEMSDLKKVIQNLTNKLSFICISGILDAYEKSILLVEHDDFLNIVCLYKADGNAIMIYLSPNENDGFYSDIINFVGKRCMIPSLKKEKQKEAVLV